MTQYVSVLAIRTMPHELGLATGIPTVNRNNLESIVEFKDPANYFATPAPLGKQ